MFLQKKFWSIYVYLNNNLFLRQIIFKFFLLPFWYLTFLFFPHMELIPNFREPVQTSEWLVRWNDQVSRSQMLRLPKKLFYECFPTPFALFLLACSSNLNCNDRNSKKPNTKIESKKIISFSTPYSFNFI